MSSSGRALVLLTSLVKQAVYAIEQRNMGVTRRLLRSALAMMDEGARRGYFSDAAPDRTVVKFRR